MNYHYQKTTPQLSEYVRTVLVFDNDLENADLPLFTNGMPAMLCKANNRIALFGQSVPNEAWTSGDDPTIVAFFFKPFVLGTIFNLSAQHLKAQPIELNLWNAHKAMALSIQLYHSKSTQEKVEILSHFLFTQIEKHQRDCEMIRMATDAIIQDPNSNILSKLLQELHITERTFQRTFKKYVGIPANQYRRICQHYFAFSQIKEGHFEKLIDVAYSNGYFDQSHFIRSFKEFTNTTPNEYLQSGLGKAN
jgi:AraC-like DNA-binding protein